MKTQPIAWSVAMLIASVGSAMAQTEPGAASTPDPRPDRLRVAVIDTSDAAFRKLDTDHDGRISALEANSDSKVAERFLEADKNRDGFLSAAEFRTLATPRSGD